jgi:hypothetical protein
VSAGSAPRLPELRHQTQALASASSPMGSVPKLRALVESKPVQSLVASRLRERAILARQELNARKRSLAEDVRARLAAGHASLLESGATATGVGEHHEQMEEMGGSFSDERDGFGAPPSILRESPSPQQAKSSPPKKKKSVGFVNLPALEEKVHLSPPRRSPPPRPRSQSWDEQEGSDSSVHEDDERKWSVSYHEDESEYDINEEEEEEEEEEEDWARESKKRVGFAMMDDADVGERQRQPAMHRETPYPRWQPPANDSGDEDEDSAPEEAMENSRQALQHEADELMDEIDEKARRTEAELMSKMEAKQVRFVLKLATNFGVFAFWLGF